MRIIFYSPAFKAKRASHRLRGELMAKELQKLGYNAIATRGLGPVDSDTIVVFLKYTQPEEIEQAKAQGAFTIYDMCDNKFDERPEFAPCCLAADVVTANSEQMAVSIKENTGRDSVVIPDPAERPVLEPKFEPGETIKLLWYGSSASLKFVPWVELWQQLESQIVNYELTIVTAKSERLKNKMIGRFEHGVFKGVNFSKINFLDWDWELQGEKLKDTDLVFIPVTTENYRTDTKSANRLIDGLISGRFVVTSPLASYLEFDRFTWQQDLMNGIQWARNNPERVLLKITEGQQYVIENFSPEEISKKWVEVFNHGKS